jgi:hypothetical protein
MNTKTPHKIRTDDVTKKSQKRLTTRVYPNQSRGWILNSEFFGWFAVSEL